VPRSTYFVMECPTCGRNLQVRIEYLGKRVVCQHCSATFKAVDSESCDLEPSSSDSIMQRAEELLRTTEESGIGIS